MRQEWTDEELDQLEAVATERLARRQQERERRADLPPPTDREIREKALFYIKKLRACEGHFATIVDLYNLGTGKYEDDDAAKAIKEGVYPNWSDSDLQQMYWIVREAL